jgi:hypothetical protein
LSSPWLWCGGVRLVCQFLELTGLLAFVAVSYGVQQRLNVAPEETVVSYASAQREKLAAGMKPRTITVCEDETFHPEVCRVGVEPVANFILLERYAESRSAEAWTAALQRVYPWKSSRRLAMKPRAYAAMSKPTSAPITRRMYSMFSTTRG